MAIVIVVGLFVIGLVAGAWHSLNHGQLQQVVISKINHELTTTYHKNIQVDSLQMMDARQLRLTGITINDNVGKPAGTIPTIDINLSIWSLLRGDFDHAISEIIVHELNLDLIQGQNEHWNIEQLWQSTGESKSDFGTNIKIIDSRLNVIMHGHKVAIQGINLDIDAQNMDKVLATGTAFLQDAKFHIAIDVAAKQYKLQLVHGLLDIKDYLSFIPEQLQKQLTDCGGDLKSVDLQISHADTWKINGSIQLQNLQCKYKDYTITKGQVLAVFQGESMQFFVKGYLNNQELSVKGNIEDFINNPHMEIILKMPQVQLSQLFTSKYPVEGRAHLQVFMKGTMDNLQLQLKLRGQELSINSTNVQSLDAKLHYHEHSIDILQLEARGTSYLLQLAGRYELDTESYKAKVQVQNFNLDTLRNWGLEMSQLPKGDLSIVGEIAGTGLSYDNLAADLSFTSTNLQWNTHHFSKVDGLINKRGSTITIQGLIANLARGGSVAINGIISQDSMKIDILGSNLQLAGLQAYVPASLGIRGSVNIRGQITGSLHDPELDLHFFAEQGKIAAQPFDILYVHLLGPFSGLNIADSRLIKDGKIYYTAKGVIDISKRQIHNLVITSKEARLENLSPLIPLPQRLTGNLTSRIMLNGMMSNPQITGTLNLWEGSVGGFLISNLNLDFTYNDGRLELDGNVDSPFISGSIKGVYNSDTSILFDYQISQINMERFAEYLPYPITGSIQLEGTLRGTTGNPILRGRISGKDISFNGMGIEGLHGQIKVQDQLIHFEELGFTQKTGTFTLNGRYNYRTESLFGHLDIKKGDSNAILAMLNLKNDILQGEFDGSIELGGTIKNPYINFNGSMTHGELKSYPLQNITIDAQLHDKVLTLKKFFGQQNQGKVAAIGTANFNTGELKGRMSANDMDIKLFTHLMDLDMPVSGLVNMDVQLKGSVQQPEANISITLTGDGSVFTSGYVLANIKDNIINVNQAAIFRDESAVKAHGIIPLVAINSDWKLPPDGSNKMDLQLKLENTDLKILPTITPYIQMASGQLQGQLQITGTMEHPALYGNIRLDKGMLQPKYLKSPLENMNIDINFNKDLMTISQFNGMIGTGKYTLAGQAKITGDGLQDYNFILDMDDLNMDSPFYKGKLTGTLGLREYDYFGKKIPQLSLHTNLSNIKVAMPPLPESSTAPLPLMGLDININVGNHVHAFDPLLYDLYITGNVNIQGTTHNPNSSGSLVVERGTINFLKTVFKVNVGKVEFNRVGSLFPSLDFLATTNLDRTKIFMSLKGSVDGSLEPKLYSEPAMNDAEILKLLAFRSDYQASDNKFTQSELLSLATIGLQMSFLNEIEGTLRNVLDLDMLRVSRDTLTTMQQKRLNTDTKEVYNIEIGKYISDKVMLKYTKGVNYDFNEVGLQYYVNKHLGIGTQFDMNGQYNVKLDMQWSF